jgi:hypothetical protein
VAVTDGGGLGGGRGRMLAVAIAAEMIYQLVGANLSSPQSNELNAAARAPTLRKWVNLTNAEAAGWVVFLCVLDDSLWPALGGGLAGVGMMLKYRHAIRSGLAEGGQPTEHYGQGGPG